MSLAALLPSPDGRRAEPGPRRRWLLAGGLFTLAAARGRVAGADAADPDASLEIEELHAGIVVLGGSIGGGLLRFGEQEHAVSVQGLDFGPFGIATMRATGDVFGLRHRDDFPGVYRPGAAPAAPTAADDGAVTIWMTNEKGVRLRLRTVPGDGQLRILDSGLVLAFRTDTP